jgi:hypothetical protein
MTALLNNELKGIWKEVVVAQFKVLPQYLPRGTLENLEGKKKTPQSA